MKVNDAVPGTLLLGFAAAVVWQTLDFPPMPGQRYSAALFPQVIAALMALSGVVLIGKGIATRRDAPVIALPDWLRSPRHLLNFFVLMASLAFYIAAAHRLGFIPTAFLVLTALMGALRGVRRLGSSVAIAAVASVAMQQFFGGLLRVPLPYGIVPPSWF